MNNNNNKKFIVYLDDKQSKNFNRMFELYKSVKDLDNEIKNLEIGIANREIAQEAILIELEKMITGK